MYIDIFYSFLIIIIIVVIYLFVNEYNKNKNKNDCPDILIQKGKYIYLMNKYNKAILKFNNLDEYRVYYKNQQKQIKLYKLY